jgi:hypothetical protein
MICLCRAEEQRFEAMTVTCCGGEALALFGHVEEAELFLWSLGTEGSKGGWQVRESRCGEVMSVLCGPCANAKRVVLDPLPTMLADGTAVLASVDRGSFMARLLARRGVSWGLDHRVRTNASSSQREPCGGFVVAEELGSDGFTPGASAAYAASG